jgi:putative iron-regulated protein
MKLLTFVLFSINFISLNVFASDRDVVTKYQKHVSQSYSEAVKVAEELNASLVAFVDNPSELTQSFAKQKWIDARRIYSPTEIFRFYGGPIDDEDGPEGAINAWPLDEVYIDYVIGDKDAGIINKIVEYPTLTKELLRESNEKEGEKNIATGFHAIEFLLWGQDIFVSGPGERKFTDYTTAKNADRRGQYLKLIGEILIEDLKSVRDEWDISTPASYANEFIKVGNEKESLKKIFLSLYSMSAEELSQERIFVAYDTQAQEDEHSCFSDTTHLDIYYNYMGIQNVLAIVWDELQYKDAKLASDLFISLRKLELGTLNFPKPFDQAILSDTERPMILSTVRSLEDLGTMVKEISKVFDAEF